MTLDATQTTSGTKALAQPVAYLGPLFIYVVVLLVAIATSTPRRVGDGQEYMAMAMNLADAKAPSLSADDRRNLETRFSQMGAGYPGSLLPRQELVRNGREEFSHFWFYSLLAAPLVALANASGVNPGWAFTAINAFLLALAFSFAIRRIAAPLAFILFLSPILWWVDKPAIEPFMFALIAIAIALIDRAPWWSLIALALASAQNPPVALVLPSAWFASVLLNRGWLRGPRLWFGTAIAVAISVIHPLYYFWTLGAYTPQVLVGSAQLRIPTPLEFVAPVTDLNIGLIPNVPLLAITVVVLGVIPLARLRVLPLPVACAIAMAAVFLLGFSQTTHFNSGTEGPSRYALWLIPLTIPLFAAAATGIGEGDRRAAIALAGASYVLAWTSYAPRVSDAGYLEPTPIASFVWAVSPALDNPLPAIFYSRTAHQEGLPSSVGTPTCSKVLIVDGVQASNCPVPVPLPPACFEPTGMCYANRDGDRYDFVATERDLRR
jgi:hypothetical protein